MRPRHIAALAEDNPEAMAGLIEIVKSLDHDHVPLTTLDEIRDFLATGQKPRYWIQDMQMPASTKGRAHEKVGETSARMVRKISSGPFGIVIIVVTGFSNHPDFVVKTMKLDVDDFVMKSEIEKLPDRIQLHLKEKGREDHANCAACNARSRPAESAPPPPAAAAAAALPVARLLSHEWMGAREIGEAEVAAALEKRKTLDLFVNLLKEEDTGFRAGRSDRKGRFHEVFLPKTAAQIVAELVEERRPVKPTAFACLREAGLGMRYAGAVRLVEQARRLVDINGLVNGKESRKKWRAFQTMGTRNDRTFWFDPPPGFRWGVLVRIG